MTHQKRYKGSTVQAVHTPVRWLDTKGIAEHLGVSVASVRTYIKAGMPAHRPTPRSHYRFNPLEVDLWLASQ